jgi:sulfur carrier protein ThiS
MNIIVNGSPRDVPDKLSAAELLGALGIGNKRLQPGDRVEIVHAIGGG